MKWFNRGKNKPVAETQTRQKSYVIVYNEASMVNTDENKLLERLRVKYGTDDVVIIVTDNPVEMIFNESNN